MKVEERLKIGLALGSGSARGWSHIGVIQALAQMDIKPDVVAGSSIGSLVGAAYVLGHLERLDEWVRTLTWRDVLGLMDFTFSSGFIEGERLMQFFATHIEDMAIESSTVPYAAVATDLYSGREVWFQEGSILQAVRASIAIPGFFTPMQVDGRFLVDGGLVNPVPVSLCRALGADVVIAVNLNNDVIKKPKTLAPHSPMVKPEVMKAEKTVNGGLRNRLKEEVIDKAANLFNRWRGESNEGPGIFQVISTSLNIMQDRITRSRMAGDPPEVLLNPRLSRIDLLEFHRAEEAIAEGVACVERNAEFIKEICNL